MSEISIPCWAPRYEVDPRYDYRADTFVYDAPGLAPGCGHENCLAELARHKTSTDAQDNCTGRTMWDCPITACRYDTINASCDLDDGHGGDHRFVASSDVVLEFGPAPLLRGDAVELPGFESVEAAPDQRSRPWTA